MDHMAKVVDILNTIQYTSTDGLNVYITKFRPMPKGISPINYGISRCKIRVSL